MDPALTEVLPEAIAIAISPVPILAIILMLTAAHGVAKAIGLTIGALIGLVGTWTLVTALGRDPGGAEDGGPSTWAAVVQLVLAVAYFSLAYLQFKGRPTPGEKAPTPAWMLKLDSASPLITLALGIFVVIVLNPKNLSLTVSAALAALQLELSRADNAVTLVLFALVALSTFVAPIVVAVALGERGDAWLASLRRFLEANSNAIMTVLFLILGTKAATTGITAFT